MRMTMVVVVWMSFLLMGLSFASESVRIRFPASLVAQFPNNGSIDMVRPALFGVPSYREVVDGLLVYGPEAQALACECGGVERGVRGRLDAREFE